MLHDVRLLDYLELWEQSHRQQQERTPEELAHETPELIEPLRQQIARRRQVLALLHPSEPAGGVTVSHVDESTPPTGSYEPNVTSERVQAILRRFTPNHEAGLGIFGAYRVLRLLGYGGMGAVFLAEDPRLRRRVALKIMLPSTSADGTDTVDRERFLREAQSVAALRNDHVVVIHEVGEIAGLPYLAMEWLEGCSLEERLRDGRPLPESDIIRIGREIATGLAAAHAAGLVHRDIKPGNIWLEAATDRVKLLDFGLARPEQGGDPISHSGLIIGTPAFMAPEQARGEHVDARSDLFSLGAVLYRACTGRNPFQGHSTMAILMALGSEEPPPIRELNPAISVGLANLVLCLLAKSPAERLASATATIHALTNMRADPNNIRPATNRTPMRREWRLLLPAVVLLFVIALIVILIQTPTGTLEITVNDPDIELTIRMDGVVIREKTKAREIELRPGQYTIEVSEGQDGVQLSTDRFEIRKRGVAVLTATLLKQMAHPWEGPQYKAIASASPKELATWATTIQRDYLPMWIGAQVGGKEPRFHAIARKVAQPVAWVLRFSTKQELRPEWDQMVKTHRQAAVAVSQTPKFLFARLWVPSERGFLGLTCPLDDAKREAINASSWGQLVSTAGEELPQQPSVYTLTVAGETGPYWEVEFDVRSSDLARVINERKQQGYRPKFIAVFGQQAPHFQVCFVRDTPSTIRWEWDTDVAADGLDALIQAKAKRDLHPVSVVSHHERGQVKYTLLWEEHLPATSVPIDRRAAEWVLSVGGAVSINDQGKVITNVRDLPTDNFRLTSVRLDVNPRVTPEGLALVAACGTLRSFRGQRLPIPLHHVYRPLANATLTTLSCPDNACDSRTINELFAAYPKLQDLDLSENPVTDAFINQVPRWPALTRLMLNNTKISSASLPTIARLTELQFLHLSRLPLNDADVKHLTSLKKLRHLDVRQTNITGAGVTLLKDALPECQIFWEHNRERLAEDYQVKLNLSIRELVDWDNRLDVERKYYVAWVGLCANASEPRFDAIALSTAHNGYENRNDTTFLSEWEARGEARTREGFGMHRFLRFTLDKQVFFMQLRVNDRRDSVHFFGSPTVIETRVAEARHTKRIPRQFDNYRMGAVHEEQLVTTPDPWCRQWTIEKNYPPDAWTKLMADYRAKGYLPVSFNMDTGLPSKKGCAVFAENTPQHRWDFTGPMTRNDFDIELAKQKKAGFRPWHIGSYVEDGKTYYMATWLELGSKN